MNNRSFHHRIAKLSFKGDWRPKCQARDCLAAAEYACEWAMRKQVRTGGNKVVISGSRIYSRSQTDSRIVTGGRIYCSLHAGRFAKRHNIDIETAPLISFDDIEKSDRNEWSFAKNRQTAIENRKL